MPAITNSAADLAYRQGRRERVLAELAEGKLSVREIAEQVGVSRQSVHKLKKKFLHRDAELPLIQPLGPRPQLTSEQIEALRIAAVREKLDRLELIRRYILREFGCDFTPNSISRLLRAKGIYMRDIRRSQQVE
jgi:transposase